MWSTHDKVVLCKLPVLNMYSKSANVTCSILLIAVTFSHITWTARDVEQRSEIAELYHKKHHAWPYGPCSAVLVVHYAWMTSCACWAAEVYTRQRYRSTYVLIHVNKGCELRTESIHVCWAGDYSSLDLMRGQLELANDGSMGTKYKRESTAWYRILKEETALIEPSD